MTKEYRMTRPNCYKSGLAAKDPRCRNGYYIKAESEEEAHKRMKTKFPYDSHFDCEVWKG